MLITTAREADLHMDDSNELINLFSGGGNPRDNVYTMYLPRECLTIYQVPHYQGTCYDHVRNGFPPRTNYL